MAGENRGVPAGLCVTRAVLGGQEARHFPRKLILRWSLARAVFLTLRHAQLKGRLACDMKAWIEREIFLS